MVYMHISPTTLTLSQLSIFFPSDIFFWLFLPEVLTRDSCCVWWGVVGCGGVWYGRCGMVGWCGVGWGERARCGDLIEAFHCRATPL